MHFNICHPESTSFSYSYYITTGQPRQVFSDSHDPRTADSHCSGWSDQIEVDDVTLAIRVRSAWPSFRVAGRPKQGLSEYFGIGLTNSNGRKYPCLVSASWMIRVQAVLLKLATIDNRTFAIRQLHLGTSVADRRLLTIRMAWVCVQIGQPSESLAPRTLHYKK